MNHREREGGPIFDQVHAALQPMEFYRDFLDGRLDRQAFATALLDESDRLVEDGS